MLERNRSDSRHPGARGQHVSRSANRSGGRAGALDTTAHAWEGLGPAIVAFAMLTLLAMFNAWSADTTTQVSCTRPARAGGVMLVWAVPGHCSIFSQGARFGRLSDRRRVPCRRVCDIVSGAATRLRFLAWLGHAVRFVCQSCHALIAVYFHVATIKPLSLHSPDDLRLSLHCWRSGYRTVSLRGPESVRRFALYDFNSVARDTYGDPSQHRRVREGNCRSEVPC